MKILWIYKYVANYNIDKWFHLEYVRWMKNNGYDIVVYGPSIQHEYKDLIEIPYNPEISWDTLLHKIKPTVAILNTKSRMFEHYSPHTKEARGCILPNGFASSKAIPKIMIEEDAHYESDGKWYQEQGIDLILQRHYSQSLRDWGIKTLWLPFSVDASVFKPEHCNKIRKICFTGHITNPYPERRFICDALKQADCIDIFENRQKVNDGYIKCLQSYVAHLSTGSAFDICAAKNFEIMSSGSVLVTTPFSGLSSLFPDDCYINIKLNGSNAVEKVYNLLQNDALIYEVSTNGRKCILNRHTNRHRTEELVNIINTL